MSFGHISSTHGEFHVDTWGAGPFYIRVDGTRYKFEDSDMFGPVLLTKGGDPKANQPAEKHKFWKGYNMWRRDGRRLKCKKVCIWAKPKPGTYWKDDRGISHFLTEPDLEEMGYIRVPKP